jgi:tetratricopeptide (TPR) repeat protein
MKNHFVFLLLVLVISMMSPLISTGKQNQSSGDLKANLPQLEELLTQDPAEFYRRASLIIKTKISDKDDAVKFYLLLSDYHYFRGNYDSALWSLHSGKSYLESNSSANSIKLNLYLASIFYYSGNLDSLEHYQKLVIDKINKEDSQYEDYLLLEGLRNSFSTDHVATINSLLKAIEIYKSKKNDKMLAVAYNNISNTYKQISDQESYLKYLLLAISINKRINNLYHLVMNYNNIGSYYKGNNDLDQAFYYYDLAYNELQKLDYPLLKAQNLTNRANIYEKNGNYDLAEKLFLECEFISEKNQIQYGKLLSHINLGNLYRLQGQFERSEMRLNQALKLATEMKTKKEKSFILQRMFWLERDRGGFEKALDLQSQYHALNDSLVNESVKNEANALKEKFESEKKEKEIITLTKDKLYQRFGIALMAFVILLFGILFYGLRMKHIRLKKERQKENQRLQAELELKEKELMADSLRKVSVMHTKESVYKDLKELVMELPKSSSSKFSEILKELKSDQDQSILSEFETRFSRVHEHFFSKLLEYAPELTPTELRIAALMRLNFTSKEIANITNRGVGTIDNMRSSIRRKLQLKDDENLQSRLIEI